MKFEKILVFRTFVFIMIIIDKAFKLLTRSSLLIIFFNITVIALPQADSIYIRIEKEISHYNYERALDTVNKYLEIDPNNSILQCYKGAIYILEGDSGYWFKNYINYINLNSRFNYSYFQLGESCYKTANIVIEGYKILGPPSEYLDYLKTTVDALCQLSVPFYEHAYQLDNQDSITKQRLKEMYTRCKMYEPLKRLIESNTRKN